jgi:hypothetical protein
VTSSNCTRSFHQGWISVNLGTIGIISGTSYPETEAEGEQEFVKFADVALYSAKEFGPSSLIVR